MMMAVLPAQSLYTQVVNVTIDYMGPTAGRFINRQIHAHLNKDPKELNAKDLDILTDWIKIEIALLTEDSKVVEDFTDSLHKLAKSPK